MERSWLVYGLLAVAGLAMVGYVALSTGALAPYLGAGYDATEAARAEDPAAATGYEHVTVTAVDGETSEELGTVEAAVADSFTERYVGLSETEELPEDHGMLFVHDEPGERTYVMRNMAFGIDVIFVAPNGTITTIHQAPAPAADEDGEEQRYTGDGQYVLEVNRGWCAEHGVEVGDRLEFEVSA